MQNQIAFLSTVVNFDLYQKSARLFPKGIPRYVIDGRNGMHAMDSVAYMFKKLKNKGIEWLVMADEDVVMIHPERVLDCIEYMREHQITFCGVRDGGVIPHRFQNPYAINTFFSILHFSEIEPIWNERLVRQNQYIQPGEFNDDLSGLTGEYSQESLFEPYYCFYFWMRRNGKKVLFLEATVPFADDPVTNLVQDHQGRDLLYHTWYARSYGASEKHTQRIDAVFAKVSVDMSEPLEPIIFKDPTFAFKKSALKQYRRVVQKIESILKK